MTDKLQQINKMIASIEKELKSNASKDQKRKQRILLNVYMKKKEELEK